MTKEQIRKAYHDLEMGYEAALDKLVALGMNEGQADNYLYSK